MEGFVVVPLMIILVVVGIIWTRASEQKRSDELTLFFERLSLAKVGRDDIPKFEITSRGGSKKRFNNFQGEAFGLELCFFDYEYTVGGVDDDDTYTSTVGMTSAELPVFQLSKEGLFDRIADVFTGSDIDFTDHEQFSNRYVLKGCDEHAVRKLFMPEVLDFFIRIESYFYRRCYVESNGKELLFCFADERMEPENMDRFVFLARDCFKLFGCGA